MDDRLAAVYGPGEPPFRWGTLVRWRLGGPKPLDGISPSRCADGRKHLHYCTYGFTSLYYNEKSVGEEHSGWGFELTFRLAAPRAEKNPIWVCGLLQSLARYVFNSGRGLAEYHWLDMQGPVKPKARTDIVGLAVVTDPALPPTDSPHGRVEFLQLFGITATELGRIKSGAATCEEVVAPHRAANPMLVTDLSRKDG